MSGWDAVGLRGSDHIRSVLADCADPVQVIERFQQENAFQSPTLQSALPLLDLHGMPRHDFYSGLFSKLSDRLLTQVKTLPPDDIVNLIDHTLRYGHIEVLRPVVMQTLEQLEKIPERILDRLASDPTLYGGCSLRVKRDIWERNPPLFAKEVSALLDEYVAGKETSLLCSKLEGAAGFFDVAPRTRRQNSVVRQLMSMVKTSLRLYEQLVEFLRELFVKSRTEHYCTLRSEVLMALHDGEVSAICMHEPCHKFVWCLDACIRERCVDDKRAKELASFLDLRPHQEEMRGWVCTHLFHITPRGCCRRVELLNTYASYYPGQKNWDSHASQTLARACLRDYAPAPRAGGLSHFFGQGSSLYSWCRGAPVKLSVWVYVDFMRHWRGPCTVQSWREWKRTSPTRYTLNTLHGLFGKFRPMTTWIIQIQVTCKLPLPLRCHKSLSLEKVSKRHIVNRACGGFV